MNLLRPLLALAVVVAACWANFTYSEHHEMPEQFAIPMLFDHLNPAVLVGHAAGEAGEAATEEHGGEAAAHAGGAAGGHGDVHPLLSVPLPAFLAFADMDHGHDGVQLFLTNLQIFQLAAVLLVLILLGGVPSYVRTGRGDALTKVFAGFCMYIRDEMVYAVMGEHHGRRFVPYFLAVFFFIVFMNLMGLVPFSSTPTAVLAVTFALAATTLVAMLVSGMIAQGPIAYFKNLVPHVPWWLWPLMFIVELIGQIAKPFALMVRLFANMSGGHMVVLSFMGLIFLAAQAVGSGTGWGVGAAALPFAVFIMIIEVFVALLQAYVFTYLSILFVGGAIHPEH